MKPLGIPHDLGNPMTQRLRFCFTAGFLGAFVQETKDLVKGCNSDGADEEKVGTLPDCSAGLLHQARCFYYVYIYYIYIIILYIYMYCIYKYIIWNIMELY